MVTVVMWYSCIVAARAYRPIYPSNMRRKQTMQLKQILITAVVALGVVVAFNSYAAKQR